MTLPPFKHQPKKTKGCPNKLYLKTGPSLPASARIKVYLWDLPNPGIKPQNPALQADSLQAEPQGKSNFDNHQLAHPDGFTWIKPHSRP